MRKLSIIIYTYISHINHLWTLNPMRIAYRSNICYFIQFKHNIASLQQLHKRYKYLTIVCRRFIFPFSI